MKLISWNVNGLRACLTHGFAESFATLDADIFSVQETKMQPGQAQIPAPDYVEFFNSAEKKGYSGTAILARQTPLSVKMGMDSDLHDHEGRLITLEYDKFYLVTVYTPNSQRGLTRLMYRMCWEEDFRMYVKRLDEQKPVIICGDMNVAHREIDLKNPKTNVNNAGFTPQERGAMTKLLESGFVDTFRYLYPDAAGRYSWWSYMFNARANNAGWRIDYFLVSDRIKNKIIDARIDDTVLGSDHCPVVLEIDL